MNDTCQKCGSDDVFTRWMPTGKYDWFRGEAAHCFKEERLLLHCRNRSYEWVDPTKDHKEVS